MTLFCYYNKYHSKNRIHNLHYEKFQDGTVKCIEDEIPFEVPEGWEWTRLVSICLKVTDGTHHSPDNFPTGEYKYITAKNIKSNGIVLDDITLRFTRKFLLDAILNLEIFSILRMGQLLG